MKKFLAKSFFVSMILFVGLCFVAVIIPMDNWDAARYILAAAAILMILNSILLIATNDWSD
jgi:hypothetical protein